MIPLVCNKGINGFTGFFQRITRLLHHHVLHLYDVLRSCQALHVMVNGALLLAPLKAKNALQTGLNIEHAASDIHQRCIGQIRVTAGQSLYLFDLLAQNPAWLPQTQHSQGIADLFHGR